MMQRKPTPYQPAKSSQDVKVVTKRRWPAVPSLYYNSNVLASHDGWRLRDQMTRATMKYSAEGILVTTECPVLSDNFRIRWEVAIPCQCSFACSSVASY